MEHICPRCNKVFLGDPSRKYCSRDCSNKEQKRWNKGLTGLPNYNPRNGSDKTCPQCGKIFYASKSNKHKHCSTECYFNSRFKHDGFCRQCGKISDTRFCNNKCRETYWNVHNGPGFRSRFYKRKKEILDALGGKCIQCGNSDTRVLDIHHIDRSLKPKLGQQRNTWMKWRYDWSTNLDNLQLLCANCHRIVTWNQSNHSQTLDQ